MSKLKDLEKLFTQGKITRREFMARVSAIGLMAAVSPALLGSEAQAATPKKGGRVILGSAGGSTTDSMDPGTLAHTMPQAINQSLRSNLVEVNYKGEPIPEDVMQKYKEIVEAPVLSLPSIDGKAADKKTKGK